MKILIVANGYPTKSSPQYGCFEKDQAIALKEAGHQVTIMSVDDRFRLLWRKLGVSYKEDCGLRIYTMFLFPSCLVYFINKKWAFLIRKVMALKLYERIRKQYGDPDIIYAHYLYNIASVQLIKQKYKRPLVGIEHWSLLNQLVLPEHILYQGSIAYGISDKLLSVSESLSKQIIFHFGKNNIVVHNIVAENFVNNICDIENDNKTIFRFVTVGSLINRKGFDLLVDALKVAHLPTGKWRLIIIGEGRERKMLSRKIKEVGFADCIHLVGSKTRSEIADILRNSDAFVLASRSETFGVVYIEAMMLGLPVIGTVCGGPEEFINKSNGILVPANDVNSLANALINMYHNIDKYDNVAIANACKSRFSSSVIANKLTTIFEEVIENHQLNT